MTDVLTQRERQLAQVVGVWLTACKYNSTGGCGMVPLSDRPLMVWAAKDAERYNLAVEELGWHYTRMPYDVARRVVSGLGHIAWQIKRKHYSDPSIMTEARALAILQQVRHTQDQVEANNNGGYGNAAARKILACAQPIYAQLEGR